MRIFIVLLLAQVSYFAQTTANPPAKDETIAMSVETVALFNAKKYPEAQQKAKEVIAVREKRDGKNDLSLASAWRNLAYIEMALKDVKAAEAAFDRSLDLFESNQPLSKPDEVLFAEVLEAAAYFDINSRTLGKSESRLRKSIEIRERVQGKDAKSLASPLRTLGRLHHARGEYDKAIPLLIRAMELKYEKAGELASDDLILRETAICSLRKADRDSEADDLGKRFRSSTVGGPGIPIDKTISAGVVNGKAVELAKPMYPSEARAARADGTVKVSVLIDETGKVIFACAVSGHKALQAVSEDASYRSSFSPTRLRGEAVKVSGVITYNFKY